MKIVLKTALSLLAIWVALVAGSLVSISLPINWQVASVWTSWPAMLQNGAVVVGVLAVGWLALRTIWKRPRKETVTDSGQGAKEVTPKQ